jgi:prepilin-type N-terminal cleavage/methylation domain-containing protein
MRKRNGFSLIELLIVVAVILIIAAIAIPNFLRSKMAANEASAVGSLRAISTAATTYTSAFPDLGYPATLADLGGSSCAPTSSTNACLLDPVLANGTKAGYTFVWVGDGLTPSVAFTITATPAAPGTSGQRQFCSDSTNVVRYDPSGSGCTNASLPIQ